MGRYENSFKLQKKFSEKQSTTSFTNQKQPLDDEFLKNLINDEKVPAYARAIIELLANDLSLLTTEKLAILKAIGKDRYKQLVGRGGEEG